MRCNTNGGDQKRDFHAVTNSFWLRAFGGGSDVAGRTIRLNNFDFTIIGVASRDFSGTEKGSSFDVWIPIKSSGLPMKSSGLSHEELRAAHEELSSAPGI